MTPQSGLTFSFTDTVGINFETSGSGRHCILFLHGFGASLRNWDDIRLNLPVGFRCFFLDLKGFGFSSKPRGSDYSIKTQADVISAFIVWQNLSEVTLVGHSYGGGVALLTYLHQRALGTQGIIASIVLIDSVGYGQRLPIFVDSFRLPLAHYFLSWIPRRLQVAYSLRQAFYNRSLISKELIDRYTFFYSLPDALESFGQAAKQAVPDNQPEIEKLFKKIDVPALILWGREDDIVPFAHALCFAQDLPDATLIALGSCGHIPQEEQPALTVRLLCDFLEERNR